MSKASAPAARPDPAAMSRALALLKRRCRAMVGAGWIADDNDKLTLARGRKRFMWWHGPVGLALDRALVRWVGWSPVYVLFAHRSARALTGVPILLRTMGRQSGLVRTSVLPAFPREGSWYVCATMGGGPKDPQWVKNILADPGVSIRLRRRDVNAFGRVLTGADRDAAVAWIELTHPSLPIYQHKAAKYGREIPIVALEPVPS